MERTYKLLSVPLDYFSKTLYNLVTELISNQLIEKREATSVVCSQRISSFRDCLPELSFFHVYLIVKTIIN